LVSYRRTPFSIKRRAVRWCAFSRSAAPPYELSYRRTHPLKKDAREYRAPACLPPFGLFSLSGSYRRIGELAKPVQPLRMSASAGG